MLMYRLCYFCKQKINEKRWKKSANRKEKNRALPKMRKGDGKNGIPKKEKKKEEHILIWG